MYDSNDIVSIIHIPTGLVKTMGDDRVGLLIRLTTHVHVTCMLIHGYRDVHT